MKAELTLIPKITIHPDRICTYNELLWFPSRPSRQSLSLPIECYLSPAARIVDSSRSANGHVSKNATRKMKRSLDYLLLMAAPKIGHTPKSGKKFSFRVVFVTLTLPSTQIHSDNEIKRTILNSFLIELTRYHNVKNYLWRAEKQKNGNIHFHLIIDKFILFNELRKRWNRICNKLGYVDKYQLNQKEYFKNGFKLRPDKSGKWTEERQYKAYLEGVKCDWTSPNSTDIHSIKFISNLKNYVTKYLTKDESEVRKNAETIQEEHKQSGRIWGCNQELSNIKGFNSEVDNETKTALEKIIKESGCNRYDATYFSVFYVDIQTLCKLSPDVLFKYFTSYLAEKFNYSSQLYLH